MSKNRIGREVTFKVNEIHYTLSRWTRAIDEEWTAWAQSQLPPKPALDFTSVKKFMEGLDIELQKTIVNDQLQLAREETKRWEENNRKQIDEIRSSGKGVIKILGILLRKHHGNLSEEKLIEIYDKAEAENGYTYMANLFAQTSGTTPEEYAELEKRWLQKEGLLPSSADTFS